MIANPQWFGDAWPSPVTHETQATPFTLEQQKTAAWLKQFSRRVGRFFISAELIDENPNEMMQLFSQTVILRCEYRYDMQAFEFSARSELFEMNEPALSVPLYTLGCHKEGGKFTWTAKREK